MESRKTHLLISCLLLSLFLSLSSSWNSSVYLLDSLIRDHAFESLIGKQTGKLYQVSLPKNLSPRTKTIPPVKRLVIVFVSFSNLSSFFYDLPTHVLIAPILGFSAYDATNISCETVNVTELELSVTGAPISIVFPQVELPIDRNSKIECVVFSSNGSVNFLSSSYSMSMCMAMSSGWFSIVVSPSSLRPPMVVMREEQGRKWRNWVIVSMIGVVGLALLCLLVGIGVYKKITKSDKLKEMEMKAENGEVLESVWIGRTKIPFSTMRRTQPLIENETAP